MTAFPHAGGWSEWGHAFVQAEFVGRLIHRRRLYSTLLRQVLGRNLTLRYIADYAPDLVTPRRRPETDVVVDVYIDRLLDLQIDEGLAVYVVPVRPLARVHTS